MDVGLETENDLFKKRENGDKCVTPAEKQVEFLRCLGEKTREACRDWFPQSLVGRPTKNVSVLRHKHRWSFAMAKTWPDVTMFYGECGGEYT